MDHDFSTNETQHKQISRDFFSAVLIRQLNCDTLILDVNPQLNNTTSGRSVSKDCHPNAIS